MAKKEFTFAEPINLTAPAQVENVVVDNTPAVPVVLHSVPMNLANAPTMDDLFHQHQEALRLLNDKFHSDASDEHIEAIQQLKMQYERRHAELVKEQN